MCVVLKQECVCICVYSREVESGKSKEVYLVIKWTQGYYEVLVG